ncbi:Multidrug resistance protein stp [Actinomadura rubteroloni]|uniref:Multidrug resistance protein stp n=2 Tax=Actinomadura rubteroloni TaxID=1926885 RepID=A0A2P4UQL8_9ACTN|nr:Multidrug resistance protein stp [Actinomadura rubteroloni]
MSRTNSDTSPALSMRRRWAATVVVCLGLFLIGIDFTVLNVAIPDLQRDLRLSTTDVQWIIDGYAVAMSGSVLAAGAVADRIGRRRAFVLGMLLCVVTSVAGGLADTSAQVIAARAGMGLGSALVMPATLSIVTRLFPEPALRRRAIAVWSAVAGIGGLLGPVIGGWLVDRWSWHAGFWVNVPIAVTAVFLAWWLVPESRAPGRMSLDLLGAALSALGLTALVWAVVEGPDRGWASTAIVLAFGSAALLLVLFAIWQVRHRSPMLPLSLLRVPRIGTGLAALALMSFIAFGSFFILVVYLQGVLGYSPWEAGVRTLPMSVAMIAGSAATLPLMSRVGGNAMTLLGFACVTGSFALLATTTADSGYDRLVVFQLVLGVGCGLSLSALTGTVMDAFPAASAGLGSALNDVARQVGMGLGVAVQGSILAAVSSHRLHQLLGRNDGSEDVNAILAASAHRHGGPSATTVTAAKDAFVTGMARSSVVDAVVLGAVVVVAAACLIRGRAVRRAETPRSRMIPRSRSVLRRQFPFQFRTSAEARPGNRQVVVRLPMPGAWSLALIPLLTASCVLWWRRSTRENERGHVGLAEITLAGRQLVQEMLHAGRSSAIGRRGRRLVHDFLIGRDRRA